MHGRPWRALEGQLRGQAGGAGWKARVGSWQLFLGPWQAGSVVLRSRHLWESRRPWGVGGAVHGRGWCADGTETENPS